MNNFRSVAGLIIVVTLIISACAKDDTTPPYMRLNGPADTTLVLNTSYFNDPGVFAKDETDGVIDHIMIVNPLNKDSVGDYIITYKATDAKGNQASLTRAVHVKSPIGYLQGYYTVSEPCVGTADSVYSIAVVPSNRQKDIFSINQVYKYKNVSVNVRVLSSGTLEIPGQYCYKDATDTVYISGSNGILISDKAFNLSFSIADKDSTGIHQYGCGNVKYRKQ